jgi:acetyl/propionyl-CoA carboxylase alpha subunit
LASNQVHYLSLGTFEFLVNEQQQKFYFLEINPRIQVEHTITESITGVDLVQSQLLLAQNYSLEDLPLPTYDQSHSEPQTFSIQLRICAEDPSNKFALSVGKINHFSIPSGNGIRVDTHIPSSGPSVLVGSDFDNLLAKVIITARTWEAAVLKARRVLSETSIMGVKTNLDILQGILHHNDFLARNVDTQWLETNLDTLNQAGHAISTHSNDNMRSLDRTLLSHSSNSTTTTSSPVTASPSTNLLFRKGDSWDIALQPLLPSPDKKIQTPSQEPIKHNLHLIRVLRNQFPTSLAAEIEYIYPNTTSTTASSPTPKIHKGQYHLTITSASPSSTTHGSTHGQTSNLLRKGSPSNPYHIISPLSGRLIEMLVREGDVIVKDQVVAFVRQMKMELEIRSPRGGSVAWKLSLGGGSNSLKGGEAEGEVRDDDDNEEEDEDGSQVVGEQGLDVAEGTLLIELKDDDSNKTDAGGVVRGKL